VESAPHPSSFMTRVRPPYARSKVRCVLTHNRAYCETTAPFEINHFLLFALEDKTEGFLNYFYQSPTGMAVSSIAAISRVYWPGVNTSLSRNNESVIRKLEPPSFSTGAVLFLGVPRSQKLMQNRSAVIQNMHFSVSVTNRPRKTHLQR
jgi:hypothetical protein